MISRRTACLSLVGATCLPLTPVWAKRLPPKKVPPVTVDDKTFTAGSRHVYNQAKKIVGMRATITASDARGQQMWTRKVYEIAFNPMLETDVQEVLIKSMKYDGNALRVVNERDDRYEVTLDGAVKKID